MHSNKPPKKPPQTVSEYELMLALQRENYPRLRDIEREREYIPRRFA